MNNINYLLIAIVAILAVCLIAFLIWKNRKDGQKFEKETMKAELKPEHKPEEDKPSV
jgi:FtsZ-interacting cell division protein ZipA